MVRKKIGYLAASIGLAIVACAFALWAIALSNPGPSPRTCARIQNGMTEREVEEILGGSAHQQHHPWDISVLLRPSPGADPEWEKLWVGDMWTVIVHFDAEGKVCGKACSETDLDNPRRDFLHSIRRFLGW
jgi:hypothetical protein